MLIRQKEFLLDYETQSCLDLKVRGVEPRHTVLELEQCIILSAVDRVPRLSSAHRCPQRRRARRGEKKDGGAKMVAARLGW
jgi:hypothetical protein